MLNISLGVTVLVNCYSAKLSATLTTAFGFVKLLAAALIIIVGLSQFNTGDLHIITVCVHKYLCKMIMQSK